MSQAANNFGNGIYLMGHTPIPFSEDIYDKSIEQTEVDSENISQKKAPNENNEIITNTGEGDNEGSVTDLDVPGSEQDDEQEAIGSEDEENNYYSIGGDNHNDLEEEASDAVII
ncbi:hypothetical protein LK994_04450 [Ferruginibacter lapsinanis]|uniref:hypothetical protein n=1 Tax=Ferruginibacter lapsinanis TaxID=563172 RepID=UPI001E3FD60A|nr:hypothetical protein [Ferruginibacter lapsinanis]UEG50723.1 hypothetical protein LK994_04450 [Ferruginibacter lapsinanis]